MAAKKSPASEAISHAGKRSKAAMKRQTSATTGKKITLKSGTGRFRPISRFNHLWMAGLDNQVDGSNLARS